jgi:hypothetical protein
MILENARLTVGCGRSNLASLTINQQRDILSYVAQELTTEN